MSQTYNFDQLIDRRGTGCLKYDCAVQRGKSPDLLPLWVADMDFATPGFITDALQERVRRGVFGYTEPTQSYHQAVADWMWRHHGWTPQAQWCTVTPGVVYALACAVRAFAQPGEAVLLQQPVYYPFAEVIQDNGRRMVNAPLTYDAHTASYSFDPQAFERAIQQEDVRLFLLCNPHNPVGLAWTAVQLRQMMDICARHDVVVVSDEIHADFALEGYHHTSVATLGPEVLDRCVICTSASKTFNLAGLQVSNIYIPNPQLRQRFRRQNAASGYSQANVLGLVATEAAYRHGDEWLHQLKDYLQGNIALVAEQLRRRTPELRLVTPQSTYLLWIDCRQLGLDDEGLRRLVEDQARLWLDMGDVFGPDGSGFIRINVACPRAVLSQAVGQLTDAVRAHVDA
ncbi:MAG: pyridoxal phosphate-dependent aminotransferase [Coriobacteriales bacterium]|nr:pyridoxal phosphate-dependent aminotransferase [Coriobacteriales bacterium]